GARIEHHGVGVRPVGDPHLGAVDDETVALLLGAGADRGGVGAGIGLGDRERADVLAGNELRQVALLLLGVAVQAQLVDAQVGVGAIGEPDRARGARDFLHGDAMFEIAEPEPTPGLADRDAVNAELAEFGPEVAWEGVAAVDLLGARRNMRGCEAAHTLAQHVRRLTEPEIEPTETACQHGSILDSGPGRIWSGARRLA